MHLQVSKGYEFFKGRTFGKKEGQSIEFKGAKDSSSFMKEMSVVNIGDAIGEELCSFLNSEGGTVFVGVHDTTNVIQGMIRVRYV